MQIEWMLVVLFLHKTAAAANPNRECKNGSSMHTALSHRICTNTKNIETRTWHEEKKKNKNNIREMRENAHANALKKQVKQQTEQNKLQTNKLLVKQFCRRSFCALCVSVGMGVCMDYFAR